MKMTIVLLATCLACTLADAAEQAGGPTDPQIAATVVTANQVDIEAGTLAKSRSHSAVPAALQDAYLRAYRSMGQFRGDAALSTWLSRLVLNECNGRLRRSSRRASIVSIVSSSRDMDAYSKVCEPGQSPHDLAARAQLRVLPEQKVSELPDIFRVVFVLRSIEELGVEEVAQTLAITAETVRSRHFRAKGMLRESLAREIDLAQDGIFEFDGRCCNQVVANVLARLDADPGARRES
ncbi:MAG TPA: sigma-70 family RNA polymerase sigma factor [Steroidobacteraceae bacterium]